MHSFQYHRPSSTKDALGLAQQKSEGRYLAGGQSLVQAMKLRLTSPSDLIDLGMKSVQQPMHKRREQHRNNPNERETGKQRIERSEELCGRSRQRIDRTHAGQDHRSVEQ